jgi:hypothetical protein
MGQPSLRSCLSCKSEERRPRIEMLTTVRVHSLTGMRPDELERRLRERLGALGPAPRAELLRVQMLPDTLQRESWERIIETTIDPTMKPTTETTMKPNPSTSPMVAGTRPGAPPPRASAPARQTDLRRWLRPAR